MAPPAGNDTGTTKVSDPDVGREPVQALDAPQFEALVLDHVKVTELPGAADVGFAVSVTVGVGAGATVTVTLASADPPGPVQFKLKVALLVRLPEFALPLVAREPLQLPEAVHEVALALVQDRSVLAPNWMEEEAALNDTVGAAVAGGGCEPELPPPPQEASRAQSTTHGKRRYGSICGRVA